ncbi:RNA polymerase sporulation sigma factor SigG [Jeotgalibacillus sp. R-1-5s-1]|uniref:RNA polymerase sporulation sigma factor SigG n=1 Tax=Jeotgalibacillus sp. R-1-5s-1 TaxID=2555897 RepID=UPI001068FDBD|nr:RNA polymerase sporulation sigma factor SigG [Jeotgalibacillus sp. R-1-5s-1]TFE03568.1 RNA polymerase sporulation sigma factor SigG [Jeotgalibacillus sp. R-1-5s-1]
MARKVEICGVDTSTLPIYKNEEMRQYFSAFQNGDADAREKLVYGNLRLVLSVIQRFSHRNENPDDLFQVGCIGLLKSIDNFDLGQNVRFSTYAVPMIIGEIRRHLRDNNPIRVSRSLRDTAYKSLQAKEALLAETSKEPSIEDVAKRTGIPVEDIVFALDAIQDPVSLFEPVYQDGGDAVFVMDQIKDNRVSDEKWIEDLSIKNGMDELDERERLILQNRFFNGKTQMEVAEEIGISQAQVSRLEKGAIRQLNKFFY